MSESLVKVVNANWKELGLFWGHPYMGQVVIVRDGKAIGRRIDYPELWDRLIAEQGEPSQEPGSVKE